MNTCHRLRPILPRVSPFEENRPDPARGSSIAGGLFRRSSVCRHPLLVACLVLLGAAAPVRADGPKLALLPLTGPETVTDLLPLINAELWLVLQRSQRFSPLSPEQLGEHLIMAPAENLEFCAGDVGCIADMGAAAETRWLVFGDVKRSFDGQRILVHLVQIDVAAREQESERFGQYAEDEVVTGSGALLRDLLGLPPPAPPPAPIVAGADADADAGPPGSASDGAPAGAADEAATGADAADEAEQAAAAIARTAPAARSPWRNPLTWTAAGVGLASLATATALGVLSQSREDDARELAVSGDPLGAEERFHEAEDFALGANILFGIGGAATAAAVVLVVLDLTADEPPPATPALACDGHGCAAGLRLRF